jgi:hypothetical protein
MAKAHLRVQMGGIAAAAEAYRSSPTPNVIMIETDNRADELIAGLDELAEVCDEGTRVIVIGRFNDIGLYRDLMRRGVSEYLMAPVRAIDVVGAICGLFSAPDAKPVGRVLAAPPRSPTTSPGRSRATCRSIPWWRISISPSAPPGSTTTRIRRRASPTRCSRPTASTPRSSTGCCRNAPIT